MGSGANQGESEKEESEESEESEGSGEESAQEGSADENMDVDSGGEPGTSTKNTMKKTTRKRKRAVKRKKLESKILTDTSDPAYLPSTSTTPKQGAAGRPIQSHLLLLVSEIAVPKKNEAKFKAAKSANEEKALSRVRCIGSKGCQQSWALPRNATRVFVHVKDCRWVEATLRFQVSELLGDESLGQQVEAMDKNGIEEVPAVTTVSAPINSATQTIRGYVSKAGQKELHTRATHELIRFVCSNSISVQAVDSSAFQKFVDVLNSRYTPPHSTTLGGVLIPKEAARIKDKNIHYLSGRRNLSISYDGGKIRRPRSIYTVHVTTQERRAFLIEGDDGNGISHSAKYIIELLTEVRMFLCIQ